MTAVARKPPSAGAPAPAAGVHAPGVRAVKSARAPGSTRRKPKLTGLALMASLMPENGGRGSLEYALIKMLEDNFPLFLKQHNSDSRKAHRGWPDWTIGGPCGVLFRELKRESESPTDEQQAWLDTLTASGADADCWRPSDLLSGRIAREIAALAGFGGQVP
jgi:hypothetical protein